VIGLRSLHADRQEDLRHVLGGIAGATLRPLAAHAQQPRLPLVGFMSSRSSAESQINVVACRQGLAEAGVVDGRDVAIEFRSANGRYDELPRLASELIALKRAVLFDAGGTPAARAAKEATSSVPVVFSGAPNPVGFGLVASLSRPGGNVTRMGTLTSELGAKLVQVLRDLLPDAKRLAYNPTNPSAAAEGDGAQSAAKSLGVSLDFLKASTGGDLEEAVSSAKSHGCDGLIVSGEPFFDSRRDRLVELSAQHALPTKYAWRESVLAGGLISYGTNLVDSYRRARTYVGRILKGEKPTDLPVMLPDRLELVLNLRMAKALALEIPMPLLQGAHEVVE